MYVNSCILSINNLRNQGKENEREGKRRKERRKEEEKRRKEMEREGIEKEKRRKRQEIMNYVTHTDSSIQVFIHIYTYIYVCEFMHT